MDKYFHRAGFSQPAQRSFNQGRQIRHGRDNDPTSRRRQDGGIRRAQHAFTRIDESGLCKGGQV